MKNAVVFGLVAGLMASCADAPSSPYTGAIECYAGQRAVYEEAKRTGANMGGQEQSVRAAVAIYRDRARTIARLEGGDNDKVEADVNAYLMDFAKRFEASNDKPALDKAAMDMLRACAETLR